MASWILGHTRSKKPQKHTEKECPGFHTTIDGGQYCETCRVIREAKKRGEWPPRSIRKPKED